MCTSVAPPPGCHSDGIEPTSSCGAATSMSSTELEPPANSSRTRLAPAGTVPVTLYRAQDPVTVEAEEDGVVQSTPSESFQTIRTVTDPEPLMYTEPVRVSPGRTGVHLP